MRDLPLLDLESVWQDAHRALREIIDIADLLWEASEQRWLDMLTVRAHALHAAGTLGDLPPALLAGIAKAQATRDAQEAPVPAGPRVELSPAQQRAVRALQRGGMPISDIAATFQCSLRTVYAALALTPTLAPEEGSV